MDESLGLMDSGLLSPDQFCEIAAHALESLPHPVFVLSVPDLHFLYVNPVMAGFLRTLGVTSVEDRSMRDVMPGWTDEIAGKYEQAWTNNKPVEIVEHRMIIDLEQRYWDMTLVPIADDSGHVTAISTFARDVSSRILHVSSREFWSTFLASPIGMGITNLDGRITNANPAIQRMLGIKVEELRGRDLREFIHPEEIEEFECRLAALIKGLRERDRMELRFCGADGAVVFTDTVVSLVRGVWGKPQHILLIVQDITIRKEAEREREETRSLLERQIHSLQKALLPGSPPYLEGYAFASTYVPAYAGEEIGGDFFDIFRTEDGKIGVLIGDVAGKGIEAASLAATARSTLRAFAYDSSCPSDAMSHTNRLLCSQDIPQGQFATVFLAIVDPETGTLSYSNAGHPAPYVCRSDGTIRSLSDHSLPVAIIANAEYGQSDIVLSPGDGLVMFTDGIIEAKGDQGYFDEERVEETLRICGCRDSSEIVESLLSAARDWTGDRLADDIAIVVIQRNRASDG